MQRKTIRKILKNDLDEYSDVLKNRNVNHIRYYSTAKFTFLTAEEYANIKTIEHVWKEGDRYYKLAEKYYGDATDWWIIAKFNLKPTESHIEIGDIILIPTPLNLILEYMTG